jgi:hypothetical protein
VTIRGPLVIALVMATAFGGGAPASAGPLGKAVRLVVRLVEARRAVDRARGLHERWREAGRSSGTWRWVVARGSSTAPPAATARPK